MAQSVGKQRSHPRHVALRVAILRLLGQEPIDLSRGELGERYGSEVGFFGEDANGNVALKFRKSSGQVVVQLDVDGLQIGRVGRYDGS